MRPIVVVGDSILDRDIDGNVDRLCPDAPVPVVEHQRSVARPGGAGLAAALLAAEGQRPVVLVTAVGDDSAAERLRALLEQVGVDVVALDHDGTTPEKIRIRCAGRTLLRVDRGCAASPQPSSSSASAVIADAAGVLVADYGGGVAAQQGIREALASAVQATPVVWDPHPNGSAPIPGCWLATPNRREALSFTAHHDGELVTDVDRARSLRNAWKVSAVAVTLGSSGALLVEGSGTPLRVPPPQPAHGPGDPCGAGDRFAAGAVQALVDGKSVSEAVTVAVCDATAFVEAGGAAAVGYSEAATGAMAKARRRSGPSDQHAVSPVASRNGREPDVEAAVALAQRVRNRGGTVVATGGCFDILHAGHVRTLENARALGDCLIVCLNSDASVRARKGPGRPVTRAADRAQVLAALGCVDAVAIFDEATPEAVLGKLRPRYWVKGGDYADTELPETPVVESWGGEALVLPYLEGYSSTALLEEASQDA